MPGREEYLKVCALPLGWRLEAEKGRPPVLWTAEGLAFSLDFASNKPLSRKQPFVKAIGFKGCPLSVLDITAGWAKDAFLLSRLGCFVTAVESHPFVFHFVQESLMSQKGAESGYFNLALDDSLRYLQNLREADCPDVIYMDPMFSRRKKSLSEKSLRILKKIVGEAQEQKALFNWALRKAKKRVVVKRRRLDPPLGAGGRISFSGRSVRYDVFAPKREAIL